MADTTPDNIAFFHRVTACALIQLYRSFPVPTDLDAGAIGADLVDDRIEDDLQFHYTYEMPKHAISFLVAESLIIYDPDQYFFGGPEFPAARLTLKGLKLLQAGINAGGNQAAGKTYSAHLEHALDHSDVERLCVLVDELLSMTGES
jgi:hypothetical protein